MKSICRMLLYLIVFILKLSISISQNNTICGKITCSPYAHNCTSDGENCQCLFGFTGTACDEDVDECKLAHHPLCGNTGMCVNAPGGFICTCLRGWYGERCKSRNHSVVAECLPGWTGTECDIDMDECKNATDEQQELCHNSGTCVNNAGSYACSCMVGWQGLDCSININECEMAQNSTGCQAQLDITTNTGLIVGVILGSLLFLWGIVVVFALINYFLRKSRKIKPQVNVEASVVVPNRPAMST